MPFVTYGRQNRYPLRASKIKANKLQLGRPHKERHAKEKSLDRCSSSSARKTERNGVHLEKDSPVRDVNDDNN
jgi:hypothetical protein